MEIGRELPHQQGVDRHICPTALRCFLPTEEVLNGKGKGG